MYILLYVYVYNICTYVYNISVNTQNIRPGVGGWGLFGGEKRFCVNHTMAILTTTKPASTNSLCALLGFSTKISLHWCSTSVKNFKSSTFRYIYFAETHTFLEKQISIM